MIYSEDLPDLRRRYFRITWDSGAEQLLPYPQAGLTFLLGKNGSGKTTLLRGLEALAGGVQDARCQIGVICDPYSDVPAAEWLSLVEGLTDDDRWSAGSRVRPTLLHVMRERVRTTSPRTVGGRFRFNSGYEIVQSFGFGDDEGLEFLSRTAGSITDIISGLDDHFRLEADVSVPLQPEWLFLDCLTGCDFEDYDGDASVYLLTSINRWLEDPHRLNLIRDAFRQFAESVQIEFAVRKMGPQQRASLQFRYLADRRDFGPLSEFIAMCELERQEMCDGLIPESSRLDYMDERWFRDQMVLRFPHDLFRNVVGPLGSQVAGPWLSVGDIAVGSITEALFTLTPLLIGDVSDSNLASLSEEILGERFDVDEVEIDSDSVRVKLSGLDSIRKDLEQIGAIAKTMDIGIDGLRLAVNDDTTVNTPIGTMTVRIFQPLKLPVSARIEWMDSRSKTWRPLTDGSAGQRQILALLLSLAGLKAVGKRLVLSDEFDRGLHPTTARALASKIDALLRASGGIGIISTHNVDISSVAPNPNWYAMRSADGAFRIETELSPGFETQTLGVSADEVARMKRLILLVEGHMDVLVLARLFGEDPYLESNVRIISANGAKNFATVWDFHLANTDTPILVVHDKRNVDLEFAFSQMKQIGPSADPWTESGVRDLMKRVTKGSHPAAGEMKALDRILQNVVAAGALGRVEIHGLDVEDIVDCLPERHFKKVVRWADAYAVARAEGLDGQAFKNRHGITVEAVERALADKDFQPDPELTRLYDRVCRLLDYNPLS